MPVQWIEHSKTAVTVAIAPLHGLRTVQFHSSLAQSVATLLRNNASGSRETTTYDGTSISSEIVVAKRRDEAEDHAPS